MNKLVLAVFALALASTVGCNAKEAAAKECKTQCEKSMKDGESKCVGDGAEVCKQILKTASDSCAKACDEAAK